MASQLTGLVLRLTKGSPLTPQEGDKNLTLIQGFVNALSAAIATSLNPDGTLKAGALSLLTQIANVPLFADAFASSRTLSQGVFNAVTNVYAVTNNGFVAYAAGAELQFIANASCLGPAAVNVTVNNVALGNITIFKGGNVPLAANDILIGCVVKLVHDGTNFQLVDMYRPQATSANIGPVLLAAKADMVAAADPSKVPPVGLLQNHPGVLKAWAVFHWQNPAISIGDSFNIQSIIRNGPGDYTITFKQPFTTNNFCYAICCKSAASGTTPIFGSRSENDPAVNNQIRICSFQYGGAGLVDAGEIAVQVWGTQ